MKNAIIIYLIQFVLSFSVFAGQQDTLVIEGHFYLDGKPVFIKITNGRFAEIQHKEVETGIPKVFLAPGLIDVHINGYMEVDFAGQDLTLNGIRKATRELSEPVFLQFFL